MLERLPEQIRQELEDGELLGVDVVDLGSNEMGARIVVIVKRDSDAPELTPEEKRRLLADWQATRRILWQSRQEGESGA